MQKSRSGFTIVELLIVVVVIAILAAISIVAYTGIQQRAANASIISSASQVLKSIASYGAINSEYPITTNIAGCVVPAKSGACTVGNSEQRGVVTAFNTNLATIATLPSSVPDTRDIYNGIGFQYNTELASSGDFRPFMLIYSLLGSQQQCGVPNVVLLSGNTLTPSATGYTSSGGGYTLCYISIPRP